MQTFRKISNLVIVTALLLALYGIQPAHAATLTVTNNTDNAAGSLRQAIISAVSGDTITIDPSLTGQTVLLTSGELVLDKSLTITSTVPFTISGGNTSRVFNVTTTGTINLSGLTIVNGSTTGNGGGLYNGNGAAITISGCTFSNNSANNGGAIYNNGNGGSIAFSNTTITQNTAVLYGGGIFNSANVGGGGTITLQNSTVSNNTADDGGTVTPFGTVYASQGGGIYNAGISGIVTIDNSTLSNNTSTGNLFNGGGGAIYNGINGTVNINYSMLDGNNATHGSGGAINNQGSAKLNINNSLIYNNSAVTDGGGLYNNGLASNVTIGNSTIYLNAAGARGGGIYNRTSGSVDLMNVTLIGNTATLGGTEIRNQNNGVVNVVNSIVGNCSNAATLTSNGYNIESGTTCGFTNTGDQQNVASGTLNLGPLANNGGPTQTLALLVGSSALDAGNNAVCAASPVNNIDQRGVARPQNATCDIGAYELDNIPPTVIVEQAIGQSDPTSTSPINFTATFSEAIDPATFTASDITLGGTVSGTLSAVITTSNNIVFNIAVSGMTGNGTVTASIAAAQVTDLSSNPNTASTSTDNVVTFSTLVAPTPTPIPATASAAASLPNTGFAPNRIISLAPQPADLAYATMSDIWLEIPSLGVKTNIVGVPKSSAGWNVNWLGNDTGWLNGTAFPTWEGNSVVTGHVYNADGLPGPFVNLKNLKYGDQVVVHLYGQKYVFEIQDSRLSRAGRNAYAFEHLEDGSYLTLITCQGYNEKSDSYLFRRIVRAVLVDVQWE